MLFSPLLSRNPLQRKSSTYAGSPHYIAIMCISSGAGTSLSASRLPTYSALVLEFVHLRCLSDTSMSTMSTHVNDVIASFTDGISTYCEKNQR